MTCFQNSSKSAFREIDLHILELSWYQKVLNNVLQPERSSRNSISFESSSTRSTCATMNLLHTHETISRLPTQQQLSFVDLSLYLSQTYHIVR